MNRAELISEYETALVRLLRDSPCSNCGGDVYRSAQNIAMLAEFLYQMNKRYRHSPHMSIAEAVRRSKSQMEHRISRAAVEESERTIQTIVEQSRTPDSNEEEVMPKQDPDGSKRHSIVGDSEVGVAVDAAPASTTEEKKNEDRKVQEDDSGGTGEATKETGGET